jgi:hypothetical protein
MYQQQKVYSHATFATDLKKIDKTLYGESLVLTQAAFVADFLTIVPGV